MRRFLHSESQHIRIALFLFIFSFLPGISNGRPAGRPWEKLLTTAGPISVKVPPLEKITLKNGIVVYYREDHRLPVARGFIYFEGGRYEEPSENTGLTSLWGNSITFSGSRRYPREKLSEILESSASGFGFSDGFERSYFALDSLSSVFNEQFAMVLDIIADPLFDQSELNLLKDQSRQGISKRGENPGSLSFQASEYLYWEKQHRGSLATMKTIDSIDRGLLQNWHKKMLQGERITVLLTGDIDLEKIRPVLEKKLGGLSNQKNSTSEKALRVKDQKSGSLKGIFQATKEIPQSTILFRAPGITHGSPDYYALKLFDHILGGDSFNSYLTQQIRSKKGWAYTVFSTYRAERFYGSILLFAQTQNRNVDPLIAEVAKILEQPSLFLSEGALSEAKESIKNRFVFLAETPEKLAQLQLSLMWDGLPADYLSLFIDNIEKVTLADLKRVAERYYKPSSFFITVVGPDGLFNQGGKAVDRWGKPQLVELPR